MQELVADRFEPRVLEKTKALLFGNPMDPNTQFGRVIDAQAAEKVEHRVFDAARQGALLYHLRCRDLLRPPIVIDKMPPDSTLVLQETFAPIVPIIRAPDSDDDVIQIANSTRFGLSSSVCTNNLHRATGFARIAFILLCSRITLSLRSANPIRSMQQDTKDNQD